MSKRRTAPVVCPECGKESNFTVWDSVNTMIDPETKQAVRDGSLFRFTCPHCGAVTSVDYGFLYHQMEDNMMIFYAVSDKNAKEMLDMIAQKPKDDDVVGALTREMLDRDYLIRVVRSRNQLLEKLAIFDAGLDDRIIEFIKLFMLERIHDQLDGGTVSDMLLTPVRDGKYIVEIFSEGKCLGHMEIPVEFYDSVKETLGTKLPDIRHDDHVIDQKWALKKIDEM